MVQLDGNEEGVPTKPPDKIPLKVASVRFALVRLALVRFALVKKVPEKSAAVRLAPRSEAEARSAGPDQSWQAAGTPEMHDLDKIEFSKFAPSKLNFSRFIPLRVAPDRFAPGPKRKPPRSFQLAGSLAGTPVIPPELSSVKTALSR